MSAVGMVVVTIELELHCANAPKHPLRAQALAGLRERGFRPRSGCLGTWTLYGDMEVEAELTLLRMLSRAL